MGVGKDVGSLAFETSYGDDMCVCVCVCVRRNTSHMVYKLGSMLRMTKQVHNSNPPLDVFEPEYMNWPSANKHTFDMKATVRFFL